MAGPRRCGAWSPRTPPRPAAACRSPTCARSPSGQQQVSGAWVTAAGGRGPDFVMCVTDPVSEQLAELQLTLGEGPCHDVLASAAPVLAADLGDRGVRSAVARVRARRRAWLGAGAVFAFPLTIGAIRAGVMGLYRGAPGPLPAARFGDASSWRTSRPLLLLDGAGHGGDGAAAAAGGPVLDGQSPDLALHRAEIDQATGMLTMQLGVAHRGGIRPAAGLRLCTRPAAGRRRQRHRRPAPAAARRPGPGRRRRDAPSLAPGRGPGAPSSFLPPEER